MAQAHSGGEVYCLMRGKSGCGNTTLACNLAFQLQALNFRGARTGEVNLARPLGDLTVRQRQWLIRQLADQR